MDIMEQANAALDDAAHEAEQQDCLEHRIQVKRLKTVAELVAEDLARSGLTLDDMQGGKVLTHFGVQRALGADHTPGADGGYSIPYRSFTGDDIKDNGQPFLRVRLVGAHSDETPRYLSPGASLSHIYIPAQLRDALADSKIGKTLIITEGEKKAVAACKAGFPTVALAGIQMYQDPMDKKRLHPELLTLLKALFDTGLIDATVVLFDSDGKPLAEGNKVNADKFTNSKGLTRIGVRQYVLNPDVHYAAKGLARLIRETFPGLSVGSTWVDPEITSKKGPRGGVRWELVSKSRGLDDALVAGGVSEIVDLVKAGVRAAKAIRPDEENDGYIPLGTVGGLSVALWSKRSENLILIPGKDLTNVSTLTLITGGPYLETHFLKVDKQGNTSIDTQKAARAIADDCSCAGRFNEADRVFGTGTWRGDEGGLVVNTADGVYLQDGTAVPRIAVDRKAIYTREGAYPPPAFRSVSDAEYKAVLQKISSALKMWNYASEAGSDLVLGWMVMTVFLGAMASRPSLWLVAPRGSGKTQLARFLKSCLGGYAWHTDMAKESTGAGIRQMLQRSSSPCIMDEMEKDNTDGMYVNGERATAAILSLLRSGYSADSDVRKGTADQTGKSFRVMTSFCCVSIADPSLEPADLTRIAKIYLKPIQHAGTLSKPPALLLEEDAATFFWGTIQRWKQYQAIFAEVREQWLDVAGNGESREVDTFGVLLAAALAAHGCPVDRVRGALDMVVPALMDQIQEAREASKESDLILDTLLSLHIDVQRHETNERGEERITREKMSISRALGKALRRPSGADAQALIDVGIRPTTKDGRHYLAIAAKHAALSKLFHGTRWRMDGAWTGGLREVEGVIRNYPVIFDGKMRKSTLIPLSALNIEFDDESGARGTVVPFPRASAWGGADMNRDGPADADVPF